MRYVQTVIQDQQKELDSQYMNGATHALRIRSQAILLSSQKYSQIKIAGILGVHRNTVSSWLTLWEEGGMMGLQTKPGRGCKSKLPVGNAKEEEAICAIIEQYPQNIKKICLELEARYGYPISPDIVKRFAKKKLSLEAISSLTSSKTK